MGFGDGSGISWTVCKQSAHHSRHITMLFLMPNQQCQSIEGISIEGSIMYLYLTVALV